MRALDTAASEMQRGRMECLGGVSWPENVTVAAAGPMGTLKSLCLHNRGGGDRAAWAEEARLRALLGGVRLSMASLSSGLRCYIAFVGAVACASWHT